MIMKKFTLLLLICLILPTAQAAHYFNIDQSGANYYTVDEFSLVYVKSDKDMGTLEKEDRFWFTYMFLESVTNVKISYLAIDGCNDNDDRERTFSHSSLAKNTLKTDYLGNMPTHTDNVEITITYSTNSSTDNEIVFYLYTLGDADLSGGPHVFAAGSSVPDAYKDSDGAGFWDSDDFDNPLFKYVLLPYNIVRWFTDWNNSLSMLFSLIMVLFLSFVIIKVPGAVGWILMIPLLQFLMIFVGTIFTLISFVI